MVISARVGLIVDTRRTECWTNTASELARMAGGEFTRPNNRFTIILRSVNSKAVLMLSPTRTADRPTRSLLSDIPKFGSDALDSKTATARPVVLQF